MIRHRVLALSAGLLVCSLVVVAQSTTQHTIAVAGDTNASLGVTTFVNHGLVGVGRLSASQVDPFGDSFGSASGLQVTNWVVNNDGTYNGTFHLLPDRGYNVGTFFADFAARINSIGFKFTPWTSAANIGGGTLAEKVAAQNQITFTTPVTGVQFTYDDPNTHLTSITTGLDPAGTPNISNLFGKLVPYVTTYTGAIAPGGASSTFNGINKLALDSEALVLKADGSGYVGDEYGAAVYYFNPQKKITGVIMPPDAIQPHITNALNFTSAATPENGRRNNQGFEGVGLSPDGTRLFVLLQSAPVQDADAANNQNAKHTRLLVYDVSADATPGFPFGEYILTLPTFTLNGGGGAVNRTAAQSEVIALDNFRMLVLSRDGNGLGNAVGNPSMFKSVLLVDTRVGSPTDIASVASRNITGGKVTSASGVLDAGLVALQSVEVVNMLNTTQLAKFNIVLDSAAGQVSKLTLGEKWEGMSIVPAGDPANPNDYFLFLANDNDFLTSAGKMHGPSGAIVDYNGFAGYGASRLPAPVSPGTNSENDTVFLVYRVTITPDFTAPVIVPNITGTLGTNGWYRSNVRLTWTVTDPQSGIGTTTGCGATMLNADTAGMTFTCIAANNVGLMSTASTTIKLDKTAPVFTGMPTATCSIWPPNHQLVDIATVSAADALSGLLAGSFNVNGASSDAGSAAADIVIGPPGASIDVKLRAERAGNNANRVYTLIATATDRAGNVGAKASTCVVPHDRGK